jgi:hypothetical protein
MKYDDNKDNHCGNYRFVGGNDHDDDNKSDGSEDINDD